jgi:hypothetical protein
MQGTKEVVDALTAQGYLITRTYLAWIIRDRHVPEPQRGPGSCFLWSEGDVDRLKSFLKRMNRGPQNGANSVETSC